MQLGGPVGAEHRQPGGAGRRDRRRPGRRRRRGAGGTGCRCWPGPSWGCTGRPSRPTDQHGVGAERVGAADHRAEVAGVADLVAEHDQAGRAGQGLGQRDVDRPADRQDALRGHGVGQRRRARGPAAVTTGTLRRAAASQQVLVPVDGVVGRPAARRTAPARPAPRRRPGGPRRGTGRRRRAPCAAAADEPTAAAACRGGSRCDRLVDPEPTQARCGAESGSGGCRRPAALALATSTRAANAAGSVTARSARILRSTSTPAAFRPEMKRL